MLITRTLPYSLTRSQTNKERQSLQQNLDAVPDLDSFDSAQLERSVNGIYNRRIKRIIDFGLAAILVVPLVPVYGLVSLAIIIDDGMPVLYRAPRGGYRGIPFKICKFRSMVKDADKIGGYTTAHHDPRITKIGSLLRKTKLDEIPQLFNILAGEMSFVGPRPEVLEYVNRFEGIERYILEVRPGITDFSSLKFINLDELVGDGDVDEYFQREILGQKNALRVKYASEVSFTTDFRIFVATVCGVLKRMASVARRRG